MKKFLLSLLLLFTIIGGLNAAHIKGGFLSYEYLGPGISNPNNLRYKITLTIYMSCFPSEGQLTNRINFTIFNGNGTQQLYNPSLRITSQYNLGKLADDPCITDDQRGCYYTIVVYELNNYELPVSADGYFISYQRCCRIASMDNVENSAQAGNTYSIKIPGTSSLVLDANKNSSPNFSINDTAVVCGNSFFNYSLAAIDKDGDSLSYSLCAAFEGGSTNNPTPNPATAPNYNSLNYLTPYTGTQPMGSSVSINAITGVLSGIAPPIVLSGEYVVTVCVTEYRKGVYLAESRKELHIRVKNCIPLKARLDPKPVTCDGYSINFSNGETLPPGSTFAWNFGDPAADLNNFSSIPNPSHIYTDTGRFTVKLKVTSGGFCADSTILVVKVYPGFFPKFTSDFPYCKGIPVAFTDQTTTNYGVPTGWKWDFGVSNSTGDTSIVKNPAYTFANSGLYRVKLLVGNTFGCVDTITKVVTILDKAPLTLFPRDTSYCALDSLQLSARTVGPGVFSWSPNTRIINSNTANPIVFPLTATKYYVTLNQNGCFATDSILVNPVNNVNALITTAAVNICENDTITLIGGSNYSNVNWQWSATVATLNPTAQITKAIPTTNTQFGLLVKWGKCTASTTKNITVTPLAVPNAGANAEICKGQGTTQLQASGGITYQWTPVAGLNNPGIANPIASPATTTVYKVAVGVAGCTALKTDSMTVLVRALPPINLANDTLICSIDTLKLTTNGNGTFVWSPNYMISSLTNPTPLVSPDIPFTYTVSLTDVFGCINTDSTLVDVKEFVTIDAGKDTTICRTDGVILSTNSDALSYQWSPGIYLNDVTLKQPIATPLVGKITYYVIGNIGKCQSNDSVTITTVPYPMADAGNPVTVCFGSITQLVATGGSSYSWQPATFLSNPNIANPLVIRPLSAIRYTVAVRDTLGCPKAVTDDVLIGVYPIVNASAGIKDTSIVQGQTFQMNATGGNLFQWSPSTWLSNNNTANPTAAPEDNIEYKLLVTVLPQGCTGRDSVKVKVFKVPPSFYVPTAFSPNGDGKNEVLRPIALGIRSINYFKVYNRVGQLIFSTTERNKGWDGTFKGNPQDPATFVWIAQGETYTAELITRKGYVVLVR